ncbi:MAG: excinuclease ABC subunit UvrA, partial [Bifidobacteriaceae bacterium]|nr:excinuclease ABC subunit UvrA [Bifidobacteriaceae bacterium]
SSSLLSTSDKNSGFNVESEKNSENRIKFSQTRACPNEHPLALDEIEPRTFSFNAPWGACPDCDGIGYKMEVDRELIVPDPSLSINEGAVEPWTKMNSRIHDSEITSLSDDLGFSLDTPFNKLPKKIQDIILYGKDFRINVSYRNRWGRIREYTSGFEGIIKQMQRRYEQTDPGSWSKQYYEQYMREIKCFTCHGQRLKPEVLAVKVGGKSIAEVCELSVDKCLEFFAKVKLTKTEARIVTEVLKEIRERLQFMLNVGLNYLDLQRPAKTLSGGEAQRIRLATQIGSGLMGVLYVLDEPSIGLHQRDNQKLIATLKELRDKGNTLIVVEHDQETIESSDFLVDIGPLAGDSGGEIVYAGPTKRIKSAKNSLTAQYLTGKKRIETPIRRRKPKGKPIHVVGARENNLKDIDVNFPKGVFTCVTGVSGSGKSSLVNSILHYALANKLNRARLVPGHHRRIENIDDLDKVIHVDQGPIGRSPRSNPATYTGVWDKIRALFAETRDAKERGYKVGRFSFNVHGGRCEGCSGDGTIKIEMNFLPDVYVDCEVCHGKRYNRETLEVKYKGKNVSDILEMPIDKAAEFFHDIPAIARYLNTLVDVGLGYVKMGQMAPTLSGGESQRVKLATELHKRSTGKTVYILDEPTTGLHFEDIKKLLGILQGLVDLGNTVIVIEHNLDVIKSADWIIDLGPEGGDGGGEIVAEGTPEQVAKVKTSYTGEYLKRMFESGE